MRKKNLVLIFSIITLTLAFGACSSKTPYATQEYAVLSDSKEFEEEYPVVWKATLSACANYKIEDANEDKGLLKTDWVYSTSQDKYFEYTVNGFPRKKYLQSRLRYIIHVQKQLGGVKVLVQADEEVENLNKDGSFKDWQDAKYADSQKLNDLLKNIELKILSNNG